MHRTIENDLMAQLLDIAPDDEAILRCAERLDTSVLLEVLFTELLIRLQARGHPDPLVVQYRWQRKFVREEWLITLTPGAKSADIKAGSGRADLVMDHGPLDFATLYRALLGGDDSSGQSVFARADGLEEVQRAVIDCFVGVPRLAALAARNGTDKWGYHWYTKHYEHFFAARRTDRLTVLEIGIGGLPGVDDGGASLRMWQQYFPRALVYGIDILDKAPIERQRIRAFRGDQADVAFLEDVVAKIGPPDIIIDDGCHFSGHIITSFTTLFPHLRDGGIYVVEDTQTSYWPAFGGQADDRNSPETSVGFLKQLADCLHHQERLDLAPEATSYLDRNVVGLHLFHNIAFVEKGTNDEGSIRDHFGGHWDLRVPFVYDEFHRRMRQLSEATDGARTEPADPIAPDEAERVDVRRS